MPPSSEVQQLLEKGRAARAALLQHRTSPITVALGTWFYVHMHAYRFGVQCMSKNNPMCVGALGQIRKPLWQAFGCIFFFAQPNDPVQLDPLTSTSSFNAPGTSSQEIPLPDTVPATESEVKAAAAVKKGDQNGKKCNLEKKDKGKKGMERRKDTQKGKQCKKNAIKASGSKRSLKKPEGKTGKEGKKPPVVRNLDGELARVASPQVHALPETLPDTV